MATLQSLIDRTKLELGEWSLGFQAIFPGDGVTTRLDLPVDNVDSSSVKIYLQSAPGNLFTTPAQYALDARQGTVTLASPVVVGETLVVEGLYAFIFPQDDLNTFVNGAFTRHTHDRPVSYATLPPVEEYLVVILATIEALWALATGIVGDIDIATPEGVTIPRTQRFAQILALIRERQAQYDTLAAALNVGIGRLEISTLRRISRSTGRLVPVYLPQEIDDRLPPRRIFPRIDRAGALIAPFQAIYQNLFVDIGTEADFVQPLDIKNPDGTAMDITGYTVEAQLRRSPANHTVDKDLVVEVINATQGQVRIRITKAEVDILRRNHEYGWDLQTVSATGEKDTKFRGSLLTTMEFAR